MINCPDCDSEMYENDEDFEDMTEGQMANYLAGFGHSFYCPKCKQDRLIETQVPTGGYEDPDDDEFWRWSDEINPAVFEDLIERSIKRGFFIETLSLIHNTIEYYLLNLIRIHFSKIFDFKLSEIEQIMSNTTKISPKISNFKKTTKLVFRHLRRTSDLILACNSLGLISPTMQSDLKKFNESRNKVIHNLLKKDWTRETPHKYSEIINTVREGRKLQLKLSPLKHSETTIETVMNFFDKLLTETKTKFSADIFLKHNPNN